MTGLHHNQASYQRLNSDLNFLYFLTREMVGTAGILIGECPSFICTQMFKYYYEKKATVTSFELYWNIKSRSNSSWSPKWKFSNEPCKFGTRSKKYGIDDVFGRQNFVSKANNIVFSVKNWKSQSSFNEKKKASQLLVKSTTEFATLSNAHMKPFSRFHFSTT